MRRGSVQVRQGTEKFNSQVMADTEKGSGRIPRYGREHDVRREVDCRLGLDRGRRRAGIDID